MIPRLYSIFNYPLFIITTLLYFSSESAQSAGKSSTLWEQHVPELFPVPILNLHKHKI
jgi:hypothetical protein